jgi:hypothetical protein
MSVLYNYACSACLAGRPDGGLDALSQAVALGWSDVDHARRDPDLDLIRDRPEFDALLTRMAVIRAEHDRIWNGTAFEAPFAENLPEDLKIARLSRLWMEAKFNFAFFDHGHRRGGGGRDPRRGRCPGDGLRERACGAGGLRVDAAGSPEPTLRAHAAPGIPRRAGHAHAHQRRGRPPRGRGTA